MLFVLSPIYQIELSQSLIPNDQQILSVFLFGCLGEVKRPCDHSGSVDDHHLIVSDGMLVVNPDWDAFILKKRRPSIGSFSLTFIENGFDLYSPPRGINKGLGYWSRSKTVSSYKDRFFSLPNGINDCLLCPTLWRKVHTNRGVMKG